MLVNAGSVSTAILDTMDRVTGEVSLGTVQLDKGTHVFNAVAIGHNETSKDVHSGNHIFGLDCLRLKKFE